MARVMLAGLLMLGVGVAVGCPGESTGRAVAEQCTTIGAPCRLSDNKLGLCATSRSGQLICADQH